MVKDRAAAARKGILAAYGTFFLSGICAMSSGIIVSLLRDRNGFSYGDVGMLLSFMNIGNMVSAFLAGILPGRIGLKKTALLLGIGYFAGYLLCGAAGFLAAAGGFALIGLAKGTVLNTDTVLVGQCAGDRKKGMQILHACYASGALLCPFLISALTKEDSLLPVFGAAAAGLALWLVYAAVRLPGQAEDGRRRREGPGGRAFLKDPFFWMMTLLLFCQNGAENGVTGWLVTYYKNRGILSGTLSAYTMTIMWSATLAGRLCIAFALKIRDTMKALCLMGVACTGLYALLIGTGEPVPAVILLFLFALSMAGVNPMITSGLGDSLTSESMGVMLPAGALGGILMPLIIGAVSEKAGLQAGMLCNLVPCLGIAALSGRMLLRQKRGQRRI